MKTAAQLKNGQEWKEWTSNTEISSFKKVSLAGDGQNFGPLPGPGSWSCGQRLNLQVEEKKEAI